MKYLQKNATFNNGGYIRVAWKLSKYDIQSSSIEMGIKIAEKSRNLQKHLWERCVILYWEYAAAMQAKSKFEAICQLKGYKEI